MKSPLVVRKVYKLQVTITSSSPARQCMDVTLTAPRGSVVLKGRPPLWTSPVDLKPFGTQRLELWFYFPQPGKHGWEGGWVKRGKGGCLHGFAPFVGALPPFPCPVLYSLHTEGISGARVNILSSSRVECRGLEGCSCGSASHSLVGVIRGRVFNEGRKTVLCSLHTEGVSGACVKNLRSSGTGWSCGDAVLGDSPEW